MGGGGVLLDSLASLLAVVCLVPARPAAPINKIDRTVSSRIHSIGVIKANQ